MKQEGDTLVLTIAAVREDDSGGYQCVAENDAGRDQREIFLSITRMIFLMLSLNSVFQNLAILIALLSSLHF